MYSVKKRLRKSLLWQMLLLMLLVLLMLYVFMQQLVKEQFLTRLQHDAESLITVILRKDKSWILDPTHISTVYNRVRSGHYYIIKTPDKIIRSRSLFDFEVEIPPLGEHQSRSYRMPGAGGETWLVWQQAIQKEDKKFELWVAENISPVQRLLLHFSIIAIMLIIAISLLFIAIQQKILDRTFAVFDALRNNLQSIRQGEAESADLPLPQEISPLVHEIELLVSQLKQRIQRTRNAIGNLAHEIKRPLQIVSLYIESGGDKKAVQQSFDEIRSIVDRELRRARISGSNVVGGNFDAQQEIPALLQVMEKIYPHVQIELDIQSSLPALNLDRDDMLELSGNLIDNACKYSTRRVGIQIEIQNDELKLSVEDDGTGVDTEHFHKITQKGYRLDENREGHGLGLSICADIVASYQGRLDFQRSKWQGLKVEVSLPLH
jgi:signal transduction histidine kinase